jgi:hypothetical protein
MSPFPTDSYFPPQYHNGTNQENPSLSCINTRQMLWKLWLLRYN